MADSKAPRATSNRSTTPVSETFAQYISSQWADRPEVLPSAREQASFAAARRARLSAQHPGQRLIIPAGAAKVRSNDTDYPYRAHSAFAHLTGWGSDSVAGSRSGSVPGAASVWHVAVRSDLERPTEGPPRGTDHRRSPVRRSTAS